MWYYSRVTLQQICIYVERFAFIFYTMYSFSSKAFFDSYFYPQCLSLPSTPLTPFRNWLKSFINSWHRISNIAIDNCGDVSFFSPSWHSSHFPCQLKLFSPSDKGLNALRSLSLPFLYVNESSPVSIIKYTVTPLYARKLWRHILLSLMMIHNFMSSWQNFFLSMKVLVIKQNNISLDMSRFSRVLCSAT